MPLGSILPYLRMQNIFGPTPIGPNLETGAGTFTGEPITPFGVGPPINPKPDTRATDMLYEMLNKFPERNEPGILRKIAAGVAGLTGNKEAVQTAMYGPYIREMQDFQPRFEAVKDVASQERLQNVNLRQIAQSILQNQIGQGKLDLSERAQAEKERANLVNEATRQKRAATYDFKARNPNSVIKVDEQDRLIGINPQTNQSTFITGPDGKPVKSNELSDEDKINLQLQASLTRIGAQGAETRKTEEVRQGNRIDIEHLRQTGRIKLLDERVARGLGSSTTESQTQLQQRWENNARALIQKNPEYADWVDIDPNSGYPVVKEVGETTGWFSGGKKLDEATRKKIVDSIFTEAGVVRSVPGNVAPVGTPPIRTIRIQNDKGQTATMPENRAVPTGWKKVGYVD